MNSYTLYGATFGQMICALLCVVLSIVIVAAVRWYCERRARLNRAAAEIAAIYATLKEIKR